MKTAVVSMAIPNDFVARASAALSSLPCEWDSVRCEPHFEAQHDGPVYDGQVWVFDVGDKRYEMVTLSFDVMWDAEQQRQALNDVREFFGQPVRKTEIDLFDQTPEYRTRRKKK